ncbi:MAG: trigger factor [Clostridia bacterium]|nr:trigger factor [Bacillota bacterium]MCR4669036.1 trigger factor [Clostridia bacterium]
MEKTEKEKNRKGNAKAKDTGMMGSMDRRFVLIVAAIGVLIVALVAIVKIQKSKPPVVIPYDYDLSEYVTVADYKELPYYVTLAEVTAEELEEEVQNTLKAHTVTENVEEGVVEDGDEINIAFEGKIDGETFEGGSSDSYDVTIGTTQMIDGFIEGLIGKNVGETVTLDLQFPEDYHAAEVAGKPVVFDVTINYKKVTTVPELTEEFVKENTDYDSIEAFREGLQKELTEARQKTLDSSMNQQMWNFVVEHSEVLQYPEAEMATARQAADEMESQYRSQAAQYGMEFEDFLEMFMGTTLDDFIKQKEDYAQNIVKNEMVLYAIARAENVELKEKEYKQKIAEILESSDLDEETFEQYYGMTIREYADQNGWKTSFLMDKVYDKIRSLGKEVTKEEYDELMAEHEHEHEEAEAETEAESSSSGN